MSAVLVFANGEYSSCEAFDTEERAAAFCSGVFAAAYAVGMSRQVKSYQWPAEDDRVRDEQAPCQVRQALSMLKHLGLS